ncbi:T9SS type A sorting domain-containing protein [Flavobacterium sp. ACAM 123]|uniref:T9SS type A sorting domain-containing protein n=1 Tax=Flavobacterium sp. ACAM 123 TaxID=1189620 RepID=UPI0002E8C403|nr:T9SS type A sorting domain-containing protein [Flavobacterium sp. ACAM 123]
MFLAFCLGNISLLVAQTSYTSAASGNWSEPSTWSPNGVPTILDSVSIGNHTVTVTANAACATLSTNPGSDVGIATIKVNNAVKLTVTGFIYVISTNLNNNSSCFNGGGSIETFNLFIGNPVLVTDAVKETTVYVEGLEEFIVNNDIMTETRVNVINGTSNAARLRHKSGTINLGREIISNVQSSGIPNLGYLTNNIDQGNSKIIMTGVAPIIPSTGSSAPDFSEGTVEFRSIATSPYDLPFLTYKNLILNSPRTFRSVNNATTIAENGSLQLVLGVMSGLASGPTVRYLTFEDNTTIYISNGRFLDGNGSGPRMSNILNNYNVTYLQTNIEGVKQSGRELQPVSAGASPLKNLTISNTNGVSINLDIKPSSVIITASCTISGAGKIDVSHVFDVPTASIVNLTNGQITLVSNSTATACVPPLLNNPTINGNVVVQRFLPNLERSWRLLTAPVKGSSDNSVFYNWQNNGVYGGLTNTGIEIWGPTGSLSFDDNGSTIAGNGLISLINSSYNLRKFNNSTGLWNNIMNTVNEPLFNGTTNSAFLLFAPHSFLNGSDFEGGFIPGHSNLTASATGELITGNVTYSNILNNRFYLIGNPYASSIDFYTILSEPGNGGVSNIWVIDPTIGLGSYVTWDAIAGYSNTASSFSGSTIFQSGQGFFVRASSTETSITIKESHKSNADSNTTLNKVSSIKKNDSGTLLRVLLEKEVSGIYSNMDGCVAAFYEGGVNGLDVRDGRKLSNVGENLALFNEGFSLSIEHRAAIVDDDFLMLRMTEATVGANYKLKLYTEDFKYEGNAYLNDLFTGSIIQIPVNGSVLEYLFDVTSDYKSIGNRFKIVFQAKLSLDLIDLSTTKLALYPNPANGEDHISVLLDSAIVSDDYLYKIYSAGGQLVSEGQFFTCNSVGSIPLVSKLSAGLYVVQLRSKNNASDVFSKKLIIK